MTARNAAKPRIGFIGLGVMGLPMAGHIAAAGYPLSVYDVDTDAAERLRAKHPGATIAMSPAAVGGASDIVITMLPSGRYVRDVALGEQGLLTSLKAGSLLLDTSSSEPWFTTETAAALAAADIAMVDAPVSGAEAGAIAAELVFMAGGNDSDVKRVAPLLGVMGRKLFHVGPVGAGHAMKSINNLITAVTFMATAEGLIIGKRYGLDPGVMNDVLNVSTGMSWITDNHVAQRIISRRFDDPFKLELMFKDINIAMQVAADLGLQLPLCQQTQTLWRQAQAQCAPGSSVSEMVRVLEKNTGVELTRA